MSNSTVRRFCFTWNNYTELNYALCQEFIKKYCKYGIVGKELAPTTNTPHLQGFCNLQKPMRFSTIKKRLDNGIHIEKSMGSDTQNQTYCSKSGEFFEAGDPQCQGKRNDLQSVVDTIQAGNGSLSSIANEHPTAYIRYFRGIQEYIKTVRPIPPRYHKTEVRYYHGPPGSGKSRRALEEATALASDLNDIYYKPRGTWWDGYKQQSCVIIDDFYGWIKYDEMLKICDRYPYKVQIKGGFEEFTSKYIWITSNIDTNLLYKFNDYNDTAFVRRIEIKLLIE
ncbi:replication-association protein [Human associated cyclovirus 1]|uniref:Replication-associated protein n=1 Tax=Human associated cyclovirus 1 (isolate Homo sapiens/Pakistan/PK5510/2007) TaxID=742918 RepID=REP_HCYV5|nr:replication-association protein [Cyclovirus PK5510]D4N3P2.1 RecName: Full=Replication-associated protein; Short=Rep; AltName: Full=ATP-dependent helicase Rep; AltName: Full=RepP [Cyclovirus PK5510]ADD62457.1 replication-association protein [Cyclovirus PK5510]